MERIYELIEAYINIPYLVSFIALSYGLRDFVAAIIAYVLNTKGKEVRYAVFIIGSLLSIPFYLLWETDTLKLFVTYCVGTSIYELVIDSVVSWVKKKANQISNE